MSGSATRKDLHDVVQFMKGCHEKDPIRTNLLPGPTATQACLVRDVSDGIAQAHLAERGGEASKMEGRQSDRSNLTPITGLGPELEQTLPELIGQVGIRNRPIHQAPVLEITLPSARSGHGWRRGWN